MTAVGARIKSLYSAFTGICQKCTDKYWRWVEMSEKTRRNFVRLAEARVSKTIDDIRLIGNLSDRSNYEFDDQDVAKIFGALRGELATCRKRFTSAGKPGKSQAFRLEKPVKS